MQCASFAVHTFRTVRTGRARGQSPPHFGISITLTLTIRSTNNRHHIITCPHRIFRPSAGSVCALFALHSYIILQLCEIMETLKFETKTLFYLDFSLNLKSYYSLTKWLYFLLMDFHKKNLLICRDFS